MLLGIAAILYSESTLLLFTCAVFVLMVSYCLSHPEENVFLLCFLICFFTYLLSGQVLNRILNVYDYDFSDRIEFHTDFCLLISLIGLWLGYFISHKTRIVYRLSVSSSNTEVDYEGSYCLSVRKISRIVFYIFYVFWLLTLLDKVLYVYRYGYISYYIDYKPRVNKLIIALGAFAPSAFFLFLSTMPSKKEAKLPIALYVLYSFLTLGTGRRIHFLTGLLFVFAYYLCRNRINVETSNPWISRRMMRAIIITIPIMIIAMYLFEYIRSDTYSGNAGDYSPILGFFVRQGTSINVIKYAEKYKNELDPSARYSLYTTIRWFHDSLLNKLMGIDLGFTFESQSAATALHGTNLADFVSYKAMRYTYLRGGGWGSCYIAELYADFGYFGVFIGNILYGVLLDGILKGIRAKRSIWITALGLLIVSSLLKAPRAVFDDFLGNFLYPYNWAIIPCIYCYMSIQNRYRELRQKSADLRK